MLDNYMNKRGLTILEVVIVCTIIGILAAMALPENHRCVRPFHKIKACFATQRVLNGAVELYNKDFKDNKMHSLDQELLVKEKYLKKAIYEGPDKSCKYLSEGDLASETGYIYCDYHGDIEQKYKKSKESD